MHGCNTEYHLVVSELHLAALLKKKEMNNDVCNILHEEDMGASKVEALKTSKQAYSACLFLLIVD